MSVGTKELVTIEKYETDKKRASNFDLLRVILTIMILILHYCNGGMGGLLVEVEKGSFNYYISHFIEALCIVAVNVFIIVTGYFSCKKACIQISKSIKLYAISIFYGIIISGIMILITKPNMDFSFLEKLVTTVFSRWFVVNYCILYLFIPYINKLINSLSKKQFEILLIINAAVFYLWHTFFTKTTIADGGYGIINFINLYMVGAYIKIHRNEYISKKKSFFVYMICTLITTVYSFITGRAWAYATIFNLIGSVALFELFKSIKMENNKFINKLSTYTFSVYIIHENSFLAPVLYRGLFCTGQYWNSEWMLANLIISVIGIYVICVMIECIRLMVFKRIFDNQIDKIKYQISCE